MSRPTISFTVRCLNCVIQSPEPLRAGDIARKLNKPANEVRVIMLRLVDRGDVQAQRVNLDRRSGVFYTAPQPEQSQLRIWHIFGLPK